ncbi:glycosyltransferase [Frankia sp. R82]|uniref:glycosyltransferase n=1 Tax=Frankia sp. R82 TaxID=2950553 RepID=UPI002042E645|nr:glycosyltransferase [Frankia sp. R82]MCM3882983.1 glycosyltransferase [Frankia sp. R82]
MTSRRGQVRDAHLTLAAPAAGAPAAGSRPVLAAVLVSWCALAWGIAAKDGRYGAWAMAAIGIGVTAATCATWWARPRPRGPAPIGPRPLDARQQAGGGESGGQRLSWALVALTVGLGPLVRHPRYYASGTPAAAADFLAACAGLLAAATIARGASGTLLGRRSTGAAGGQPRRWTAGSTAVFRTVLTLAGAAGVATIRAAPAPRIDVFHLLQVSTVGLVHGADLYRQQWAPDRASYGLDGLFDVYPYLPWTSVLLAPARLLLGDVRYGLLAALAIAAICARRLGAAPGSPGSPGPDGGAAAGAVGLLPLLVVILPESMYALQQSWTEPLLIACLAAMVLAVARGHPRVAVVAFALALASKQHVTLLVPVAAAWPAFGVRRTAVSAGTALLLVAPWLVAGPRDFVDDAVTTNLHYRVLGHSLSVPGWASHFGVTLGFGPALVVLAAAYVLAWRARGDAGGFCLGGALVLLGASLMNKQTFFNHYTLPMGLLVLTAVLLTSPTPTGRYREVVVDPPHRPGGETTG